ncbi:Undecaprenyl-phosphate 4-deoxy-4-formamido-L-arabinose transferase [subsurface metagenome]
MMARNCKVTVIIPAYNEESTVGEDIDVIIETMEKSGYEYEIIIVDDGSTDKTAYVVKEKRKVKLIQHSYNRGVGAARKTGILEAQGEIIVMTDGDGTYPNQDIPKLLSYMKACDMVVGARIGKNIEWPLIRRPARWFIRKLASYLMGAKIPDLNSGLRVFKKDLARKFFNILPEGHSWVSTITLAFLANGYTIEYVPIDYYERKGKSTIHPIKDTYNFISLVIRTVMYFNPLRVFLPLTAVILIGAVIRTLYDATVLHRVKESDIMLFLTGLIIGVLGLLADLIVRLQKKE